MNLDEALLSLGVHEDTLTAEEKLFLDENGYLSLKVILSAATAYRLARSRAGRTIPGLQFYLVA